MMYFDEHNLPLLEGRLIEVSMKALRGNSLGEKLEAAMFLLPEPTLEDRNDPRTLAGICEAYGVNAEHISRKAWNALSPSQQSEVVELLREAGYHA